MRQKLFAFFVIVSGISNFCSAQGKKTAIIKGKLVNKSTKAPFNDLKISLPELSAFTRSDGEGNFEVSEVPYGKQTIIISGYDAKSDTIQVNVDNDVVDIKDITITPNENGVPLQENGEIPTIAIANDDASSGSDVGTESSGADELLIASRDPFVFTARSLGAYYFRPRGVYGTDAEVNGVSIVPALSGHVTWGQELGDQTDVFRGTSSHFGLEPSPYTFGGVNGSSYFSANAADFSKETKVSYTASDHTWKNKIMFTSATGLSKKGWAFAVSANKRWAEQGYRPGTNFDGYAYYAGISKVIKKSQFNLSTFGTPISQAKYFTNTTEEVFNLSGTNYYNPAWGYQTVNGKQVVRSSDVQNVFLPRTVLNYEYKPSDKLRWTSAIGYQFGKDKGSFLDGYPYSSPYGNYYRNLPSYYYTLVPPNIPVGNAIKQNILNNPNLLQIDWDDLYSANRLNTQTVNNVNGITGNNYTGIESAHVLSNRVTDMQQYTFNTNAEYSVNKHLTLYGGLTFNKLTTEFYQEVADLLGGQFFVNYNTFPAQTTIPNPNYVQNNLNNPNAIIRTGDKYGYDYSIHMTNALAWGQAVYTLQKFDFFAAVNVGDNSFYREGFYRNGLFPNNSYGKSATNNFLTYAAKGGVTYKITSKNYLFVNAEYSVTPPAVTNTYISAATRDFTVANPTVQNNRSVEGGYLLKSSKINARVVGYVNDVVNATEIKRFFNDDPAYYTYVNYIMQHENTRSIGTELMLDYRFTQALNVTGIAAIGEAFYANRPDVSEIADNDPSQVITTSKAYIKNYYLGTGPQSAYVARVNYRGKGLWDANISFNYLDRSYVQINPNRRTTEAAGTIPAGSPQWQAIFNQEELPSSFTVDLHAGKTFQLSRLSHFVRKTSGSNTTLYVSLGIGNLLNNTNVVLSGREQMRYDFTTNNPAKFPNTYLYGPGINYFLLIALKF
jgi:carboxypeptidase-like protein